MRPKALRPHPASAGAPRGSRPRPLWCACALAGGNLALVLALALSLPAPGETRDYLSLAVSSDAGSSLGLRDVRALAAVPGIERISACRTGRAGISWPPGRGTAAVVGADPSFAAIRGSRMAAGRFLVEDDLRERRRVCVVGPDYEGRVHPAWEIPGRMLGIGGVPFTIVGVLAAEAWHDPAAGGGEGAIYVPVTTWQSLCGTYDYDLVFLGFDRYCRRGREHMALRRRIAATLVRDGTGIAYALTGPGERAAARRIRSRGAAAACFAAAFFCLALSGFGLAGVMAADAAKAPHSPGQRAGPALAALTGGLAGLCLGVAAARAWALTSGAPAAFGWPVAAFGLGAAILPALMAWLYAWLRSAKPRREPGGGDGA